MKAQELRIGNQIFDKVRKQTDIIKEIGEYEVSLLTTPYRYTLISDIEGIELTEEWLIKFGFSEPETGYGLVITPDFGVHLDKIGKHWYPQIWQVPEFIEEQFISLKRIEFVHQLQNLYFALTGQELNIK